MKKLIQLATPGVDSFLTSFQLKLNGYLDHDVIPVYFDLGTKYSDDEIKHLTQFYENIKIEKGFLYLGSIEKNDAYVPNRNLFLATIAQGLYDADTILFSGVKDDRVSDNDDEFYQLTSDVLSKCAGRAIGVDSMLKEKEKVEWVYEYSKFHLNNISVRLKLVLETFSCFNTGIRNRINVYESIADKFVRLNFLEYPGCLECPACFRKVSALTGANLYIPYRNVELAKGYIRKVDKNILPNRYNSIIKLNNFLERLDDKKEEFSL